MKYGLWRDKQKAREILTPLIMHSIGPLSDDPTASIRQNKCKRSCCCVLSPYLTALSCELLIFFLCHLSGVKDDSRWNDKSYKAKVKTLFAYGWRYVPDWECHRRAEPVLMSFLEIISLRALPSIFSKIRQPIGSAVIYRCFPKKEVESPISRYLGYQGQLLSRYFSTK